MGFFDEIEKNKKETNNDSISSTKVESIPYNYHELTLATCGKLSTPFKLHVRDYYNSDVLKISQSSNTLKEILNFLVDGIHENVDPYLLHEKELEEIMLNIYSAFWNPVIEGYYYPSMLTPEQAQEELDYFNKHNKDSKKTSIEEINQDLLYTSINISKININPIKEDFKEPIRCESTDDKIVVYLRLPRVGDVLKAIDFVDKKYAVQDQIFKKEENINEQPEAFEEYQKNRQLDTGVSIMSMCILKYNDENLDGNIEVQMEKYKSMPRAFWQYCWSKIQEVNSSFGADPEVEVVSPITKQLVKRRCRFQLLDLIPSGEVPSSSRYASRYGD